MGGISGGQPHELLATSLDGEPDKEVADRSEGSAEFVDPDQIDLWTQPLGDFQNLMVEILEEEFIPEGWTFQVTVARDDGGLEVIAESPVSGRAESIIFHVERSTSPLGEEAVRDLLDRMAFERVHRGVLLTTNTVTPEARELVSGKPISLFDGVALGRLARSVWTPEGPESGELEAGQPSDDQDYMSSTPQ